jgi:ADP-ribosylglycohydrolase
MRTVPIGVFFQADAEGRRAAALGDSAITHFDPRCQLACAAFNAGVAAAIGGATAFEVLAAVAAEAATAAKVLLAQYPDERACVESARAEFLGDVDAARRADPDLYGKELHITDGTAGFVRVAFRLALWELAHAPSFEAGLIDVVNRGGDADTNGAIAGALLGAHHGAKAIPKAWGERVLGALKNRSGPLRDLYHPHRLLEMLEDKR